MNLTISGHHLEVTPAIREYLQGKLERIRRHFDHVIDIAVILAIDNLPEKQKRQRAEITLRLRGKDVHVASIAEDLYAAIDTLIDKLDRQVLKYKTRTQDHQHAGIKRMAGDNVDTGPDLDIDIDTDTDSAAAAQSPKPA